MPPQFQKEINLGGARHTPARNGRKGGLVKSRRKSQPGAMA